MTTENTAQKITDEGQNKYFHIMLHMEDDELNPYQYRLLGHYRRVCGQGGECYEGTRKTAEICKMSTGKVVTTRRELSEMGYINLEKRADDTMLITLIDRMPENVIRFAKRSPDEQARSPHEQQRSPDERKKEPVKKNTRAGAKKKESAAAVQEPPATAVKKSPVVEEKSWFDPYLLDGSVAVRVQTFRNQLRHAPPLPDPRPKTKYKGKNYADTPAGQAYLHLENIVKHVGEYKQSQGILLGQVLRWLWLEATGRDGKPATYADVLDYWQWIHGQGISMKDPAKIKGDTPSDYSWAKWKEDNPTVDGILAEFDKAVA